MMSPMSPAMNRFQAPVARNNDVTFGAFWNRKPKPSPVEAPAEAPVTVAPAAVAPAKPEPPKRTFMQKVKRALKIGVFGTMGVMTVGAGVSNIPARGNVATIRDTYLWGMVPHPIPTAHVVRGEGGSLYVNHPLWRYADGVVEAGGEAARYGLLPINYFRTPIGHGNDVGHVFTTGSPDKQVAVIDGEGVVRPTGVLRNYVDRDGKITCNDSAETTSWPTGFVNVEAGQELTRTQLAALALWTVRNDVSPIVSPSPSQCGTVSTNNLPRQ
jgi:hypothetical protein